MSLPTEPIGPVFPHSPIPGRGPIRHAPRSTTRRTEQQWSPFAVGFTAAAGVLTAIHIALLLDTMILWGMLTRAGIL